MNRKNLCLFMISLLFVAFAPATDAADQGVAKVIILKGSANAVAKDGKAAPLKQEQWLIEGTKVKTEKGGFAKLLFIDKSTINIGPGSEMEITSFPKAEAGVISVLQGTIRSQVTKNYMDIEDKDKSKLFVKTKTAAMGVRGTDFIVGYDKSSGASSLDVVSGTVAMAKIEDNGTTIDQSALEKAVSGDNAVLVEKGFKSDVSVDSPKPKEPIKIPEGELNKLKANENSISSNDKSDKTDKDKEEKKADKKEEKIAKEEKKEEKKENNKDREPASKSDKPTAEATPAPKPEATPEPKPEATPAPEATPPPVEPTPPPEVEITPAPCEDYCVCYNVGCPEQDPVATKEETITTRSPTSNVNFIINAQ